MFPCQNKPEKFLLIIILLPVRRHRIGEWWLVPCVGIRFVTIKTPCMKKLLMLIFLPAALSVNAQKWAKNFDFVDQCICGLALASKDHKYGYVDNGGNIIVPLVYDEGLSFKDGYTAVRKGANWQYIDSTGKAITESIFADAQSFQNGFAAVMENELYGYINTSGKVVIGFKFTNARAFGEGLAPVANKKGDWGYINEKGEFVITPEYDFADSFDNGEARVIKGDKVLYINKNNKVLHE